MGRDEKQLRAFRNTAVFSLDNKLFNDEPLAEAQAGVDISLTTGQNFLLVSNAAVGNRHFLSGDVGTVRNVHHLVCTIAEDDQ